MTTKKSFTFLAILICFWGSSQNVKDFLNKLNENYASTELRQLDMVYNLFTSVKDSKVIQTYSASYFYGSNFSYRKMDGIEIICKDSTKIQIDHEFKEIEVHYSNELELFDFDVSNMLKYCEKIDIIPISSNNIYILNIRIKDNNMIPYSRIRVVCDNKAYIKSIKYHYAAQVNFGTFYQPQYHFPVLEVVFSDYKKVSDLTKIPALSNYIHLSDSSAIASGMYANYSIGDFRPKKKL